MTRPLALSVAIVGAHTLAHLTLPARWWQGPHVASNLAVAVAVALYDRSALFGVGRWPRQLAVSVAAAVGGGLLTSWAMGKPGLHRVYAAERVTRSLQDAGRSTCCHGAVGDGAARGGPVPGSAAAAVGEDRSMVGRRARVALAFGLWHTGPSIAALRRLEEPPARLAAAAAKTVAATALAGIGFGALRVLSGGLAAPIGAHLGINLVGSAAEACHLNRVETAGRDNRGESIEQSQSNWAPPASVANRYSSTFCLGSNALRSSNRDSSQRRRPAHHRCGPHLQRRAHGRRRRAGPQAGPSRRSRCRARRPPRLCHPGTGIEHHGGGVVRQSTRLHDTWATP